MKRVKEGKLVSKYTKNEHLKVDDLVSLKITMAKENHLAGKRSRNKIKALKAGKETLEDRLARGDLAGVFGHLEYLQRHADNYSGLVCHSLVHARF